MVRDTLHLLRCPYCGTRLELVGDAAGAGVGSRTESGVLGCECCAFPIVAGIPVLIADDRTRDAMHALEAGHPDVALHRLLGLDASRRAAFRRATAGPQPATYRDLLAILCLDAEADCFLYRFSDPTYLVAEALLDGLAQDAPTAAGRAPRSVRRLGAPDAGSAPGTLAVRRRPRRPALLEAVAGHAHHRTGVRARVLRRQQPAAVRGRALLDRSAERRLPLHLAQADARRRDGAGPPRPTASSCCLTSTARRRELQRRGHADAGRLPRPVRGTPAASVRGRDALRGAARGTRGRPHALRHCGRARRGSVAHAGRQRARDTVPPLRRPRPARRGRRAGRSIRSTGSNPGMAARA